MRRSSVSAALALAGCILAAFFAAAAVAAPAPKCEDGKLAVAGGCVDRKAARRQIEGIVRQAMPELGLRATILQVDTGNQALIRAGFGNSMKGVPATPDMHFRIGAMAIPYLINLTLQLEDEGKLSLDDKLAQYFPELPEASEITLRNLASVTTGWPDWIQGNETFQKILFEDPFRQWQPHELLDYAFAQPLPCAPNACFHYAHTNFLVLADVIKQVTGRSISSLIAERVFRPLGLEDTQISRFPAMPGPALHSYTGERGFYEDATFWSPSWSIGSGTVMSGTLGDVVHSARELGRGALISKHANAERTAPVSAGLPPFNRSLYYALGVLVANGWQFQNPVINGYMGIQAYLPAKDISLAVVTTQLPRSSNTTQSFAGVLFSRIASYLAPGHPIGTP